MGFCGPWKANKRTFAALLEAVTFCVGALALSLSDVGRRFAGEALLRHKIRRADRLLGDRLLQQKARSTCGALCRVTLARIGEPVILIDWPDPKANRSLPLLRASLAGSGPHRRLQQSPWAIAVK